MIRGIIAGMFVVAAVAGVTWSASAQAADFLDWPAQHERCRTAPGRSTTADGDREPVIFFEGRS
jgi:hypothetical protein